MNIKLSLFIYVFVYIQANDNHDIIHSNLFKNLKRKNKNKNEQCILYLFLSFFIVKTINSWKKWKDEHQNI